MDNIQEWFKSVAEAWDHSELECLVQKDMIDNGFDPYFVSDIQEYWKERLDGN